MEGGREVRGGREEGKEGRERRGKGIHTFGRKGDGEVQVFQCIW